MVGQSRDTTFTRRALARVLPAVATLPLTSGAGLASAATGSLGLPAELPSDRVARLARELSEALNHLEGRKSFVTVYPSDYLENPVRHGDIEDAMDTAETVSAGLMEAITSHCAASASVAQASRQADTVALGHLDSCDERRTLEEAVEVERGRFLALCRFPTRNDPERHDKASYLLGFCNGDELEREHVIAVLESMIATAKNVDGNVSRISDLGRRA
ncbi:hypothetical protein NKI74_29615 [Mesorhizobium sp. M0494]|uniref:hypothetical protein n=1 Tax=Mesorhizobium sp. M0494 TaxID=2956951 RepID=UPI003338F906